MKKYLGPFKKTEHFIFRQWDRQINDTLLELIVKKMIPNNDEVLYIISKTVLKKLNIIIHEELFIKKQGKVLITCFYCKFQDYKNEKTNQKYVIINEL